MKFVNQTFYFPHKRPNLLEIGTDYDPIYIRTRTSIDPALFSEYVIYFVTL